MAAEYHVRPAEPADVPAIVEMLRRSLGPAMTEELWRWKHEESPFGPSPCLLAIAGSEIVAVRAFLRWKWESGGRLVRALRAVDTATRPDWRGRGIFSELTEELARQAAADGAAFVFNTPNSRSRPGYVRLGWRVVTRVPGWVRPAWRHSPVVSFPEVSEVLGHHGATGLTAATSPGDARYRTPRSREYLEWRYARAPLWRYHAAWAERGDAAALLIFRLRPRGRWRELRLCEILPSSGQAGEELATTLTGQVVATAGAHYATALAPAASPERRVLRRAGFLPLPPVGPHLTVRRLGDDPSLPDPTHWRAWHPSLGDLELF